MNGCLMQKILDIYHSLYTLMAKFSELGFVQWDPLQV